MMNDMQMKADQDKVQLTSYSDLVMTDDILEKNLNSVVEEQKKYLVELNKDPYVKPKRGYMI
jgi:hypothetical protein